MNAADYNRRIERAAAFRAFVRHPLFTGTILGIALMIVLIHYFG